MTHHLERARTAAAESQVAILRAWRAIALAAEAGIAAERAQTAAARAYQLSAASLHQRSALRLHDTARALGRQASIERRHETEHGDDPWSPRD